ncbi:MAG TPA: hypothetical protein VGP71_09570 [Burkholderiales bacterium]|nr:hypothetical protein [Burkholderiales bacterium]
MAALAALDRRMLEDFSRRTTARLREALPLRIALPALGTLLAQNVEKEIRKDSVVIRRAAEGLARGAPPGSATAHEILDATRQIDREFLQRVDPFPVHIEIPYERIAPPRLERIRRGLDLAYRVLDAWRRRRKLRDAFTRDEYERRLLGLLEVYAQETHALSHSVRLPALLAPLQHLLAERLQEIMSEVGARLARDLAAALHERAGAAATLPPP